MPQADATREWSFLVAACSCADPSFKADRLRQFQTSLDWKTILALAEKHGVLPLLSQALTHQKLPVPPEALRSLEEAWQANMIKSLLVSRELIRVLSHLKQRNIDAIPYKGSVLAQLAYGDVALRKAGDIDLLVRPAQLRSACDAVAELGYVPHFRLPSAQERAYLRSGYEYSFDGSAGPNLLELQWAIQPRFYSIEFDMEALFQRSHEIEVAGQQMRTLSKEDLILVLSVHAAKHVWGRLIWLSDIARLAAFEDVNWKWIAAQANDLGIARILQVTFLLCRELLDPGTYSHIETRFPPDAAAHTLAQEIGKQQSAPSECNVESPAYFRLMLRLRERTLDRVRFVQRLLLTPGPGEWQTMSLPPALSPFYRVIRLARVSARLARI